MIPADSAESAASSASRKPEGGGASAAVAVRGATWVTGTRLFIQAAQFAVGLILARLLAPYDFGLFASAYVVTGLGILIFEMGLGAALVQARSPSEKDFSTVFWINVLGGLAFVAIMWGLAPTIATLFNQPELRTLTPIVAASYAVSAGVVHDALLRRQLRFRALAIVDLAAATLGMAATLLCAILGLGAISLAVGPPVIALAWTVSLTVACRWRPRHFVSMSSLRRLWKFSGGLLGARLLEYSSRSVDTVILGRFAGASALGHYNRAYNLMLLPLAQVGGALGSVMFPILAAMSSDPARMRRAYIRALRTLAVVAIPAFVGLSVTASALVPILWGENWRPTIPILEVLALAGIPQCVGLSITWVYQAQGRTGALLRYTLWNAAFLVGAILVGVRWGPLGVASGVLLASWLVLPVGVKSGLGPLRLGVVDVLRLLAPIGVASALMAGVLLMIRLMGSGVLGEGGLLLCQIGAGIAVYGLSIFVLQKALLTDVWQVLVRRDKG